MKIISFSVLCAAIMAVIGFFYADARYPELGNAVRSNVEIFLGNAPCQKPITYSLDSFDSRFNISKEDFLSAISAAAAVWDKASGKNLFQYSPDGNLKINLIYDYRQEATDQLKNLGFKIDDTKSSYDALKAEYLSQKSAYDSANAALQSKIADFQTQKQKYDAEVAYWNGRGGAPKDVYDSLTAEGNNLKSEADQINADEDGLNKQAATVNAVVDALNLTAHKINVTVQTFNKIGASTGEEFSEGLYIADTSGTRIEVYQFNNRSQLIRLLAHELGHALGLDHVNDPNAIMYKLNESKNIAPTADDIAELKAVCRINN